MFGTNSFDINHPKLINSKLPSSFISCLTDISSCWVCVTSFSFWLVDFSSVTVAAVLFMKVLAVTGNVQGCPTFLSGRIDFMKSPFENVEGTFSPRNLQMKGRKNIFPLKSPLENSKRISYQILPSEERKYFLGRILNLPSKFKIEINAFWPLEVNMDHIIWNIYQIIDIWWAIIGTVRISYLG